MLAYTRNGIRYRYARNIDAIAERTAINARNGLAVILERYDYFRTIDRADTDYGIPEAVRIQHKR